MTALRLAFSSDCNAVRSGLGPRPGTRPENLPAMLVSYAYLPGWERGRKNYAVRDWAMDSGAYTAWRSGKPVDLNQYIDTCGRLLRNDAQLTEVFALDVIGDWEGSLRNTEEMWRQGVPAIPVYHAGEPEGVLLELAAKYPKIAISRSGSKRMSVAQQVVYVQQVFARVWPKRIHGLGFASRALLGAVPFHSVDASSWELAPMRFARWRSLAGKNEWAGKVSVRTKHQLRDEVDEYLKLERWARARWRAQLAQLEGAEHEEAQG